MNPSDQPGIRFTGVELLGLTFAIRGEVPDRIATGLHLTVDRRIAEDGQSLDVVIRGDLFKKVASEERPPAEFKFALRGHFVYGETPNMSWDTFAVDHAPAHLIPYVRELIGNVTTRSPLPTLNIGPVNVKAMVERGTAEFLFSQETKKAQEV